jgi:TonB family protein
MHTPRNLFGLALLVVTMTVSVVAQRPRSVSTDSDNKTDPAKTAPAPQTVKAKYEGGVFGYNKKQEGTLSFDDPNNRLVFRDEHGKEVISIPYASIQQEFADTQSRRPKSATILGSVPLIYSPINPIGYIKTKVRYVTLQFYDPDSHAGGVTSFRVENQDICVSVVNTLAQKASLVPKGEIFVRDSQSSSVSGSSVGPSSNSAVTVENEFLRNRVISLPRPVYPEEARQQKVSGLVRVLVTVDEKGVVTEAEAVSGSPLLQAAAVDAAKKAVFEPSMKEGRPVKSKTVIAYNFVVD